MPKSLDGDVGQLIFKTCTNELMFCYTPSHEQSDN